MTLDEAKAHFLALTDGVLKLAHHPDWASAEITNWDADPFGDRNWKFQFHSLRWLKPLRLLAQAGDTAALKVWLDVVQSWTHANVPPASASSAWAWRDMLDGGRARELSLAAPLIPDSALWFVDALAAHRDWLSEEANIARKNHAMHQHVGLFVVGSVLHDTRASELAVARLSRLFHETFDEEGANDEGSLAYHQLNIKWWTDVWHRIALERIDLPENVEERLDRAASALALMAQPDGRLPQIGDSARAGIAKHFNPHTAFAATQGREGLAPRHNALVLRRGYIASRSGWEPKRGRNHSHMLIRFGEDVQGHAHHDRGSVHIYAGGGPWLVDGGFHSYQNGDPVRRYTISRKAHNLASLMGQTPDPQAPVDLVTHSIAHEHHDFQLLDHAYKSFALQRRVTYLTGPDCWIVIDEVHGEQPPPLQHQWLIETGTKVNVHDRGYVLRHSSPKRTAQMHWLGSPPRLTLHRAMDGDLRGWIATRWKTLKPGSLVTASTQGHATRLIMLFADSFPNPLGVVSSYVTSTGVVAATLTRGSRVWRVRLDDEGVHVGTSSS